jgi:hypothetical protein
MYSLDEMLVIYMRNKIVLGQLYSVHQYCDRMYIL